MERKTEKQTDRGTEMQIYFNIDRNPYRGQATNGSTALMMHSGLRGGET